MSQKRQYTRLMAEVERSRWAITPDALQGILSALSREISAEDYAIFHAADAGSKTAMAADLGTPVDGTSYSYRQGSAGLMFVDGPIIPRADLFSDVSGLTSIDNLTADLKALQADASVKEIILLMDTPGGNITGVSEFSAMVRASAKPVRAFVYGMAASAGYWIASAAHSIHSVDTGEVGSIGVVATYTDSTGADSAKGIRRTEIVSSQSPMKRPDISTESGRASVQTVLDDLAQVFMDTVATNRGVSSETVASSFGQGGMMAANRAMGAGMIDTITTLDALIGSINAACTPGSTPKKKKTMATNTPMKGATMNMEEMKAEHPEAFEAIFAAGRMDGITAGAETERNRIQAIEGISALAATSPDSVRAAVAAVITAEKFNPAATAETLQGVVLAAVLKAAPAAAVASGAEALATVAAGIAEGNGAAIEPDANAEHRATVAGLIAAADKVK